jgi:predicted transcriptional regulator
MELILMEKRIPKKELAKLLGITVSAYSFMLFLKMP